MVRPSIERADRALNDFRAQEAERIALEILEDKPEEASALRILADVRVRQKKPGEALDLVERALKTDPTEARLYNIRGRALNNLGRIEEAEEQLRISLEYDDQLADAHNSLGHVLRRMDRRREAESCFRQALDIEPHGGAHLNLGAMMLEDGQPLESLAHLRMGLKLVPDNRSGIHNLAVAHHQLGNYEAAAVAYRRLVAAGETDPDIYSNCASVLQATGNMEIALAGYQAALQIDPEHGPSIAGIAGVYDLTGDTKKGLGLLRRHMSGGTASPMIHIAWSQLLRRVGRGKEALLHLAPLARDDSLRDSERMPLHFTLGDLLDDMGEYDRAFAHYREANRLRHSPYSPELRRREVDRIISVFSKENLAEFPRLHTYADEPVFIVGMPRSGTSLVEQILATHPLIYGAGELRDLGYLASQMGKKQGGLTPYPESMLAVEEGRMMGVGTNYLARLRRRAGTAPRVTDKMWQNFEQIGLMQVVLPKSRVIHCQRDPVDTGLSCYLQSFGNAGPPFSYDLSHIGSYYAEYRRLMAHWRETVEIPILDVRYEDLVADPEPVIRRMLEFVGVDWDPKVMEFHKTRRVVRTASHAQVKQPIYQTSVGRAANYKAYLGPLLAELRKAGIRVDSAA